MSGEEEHYDIASIEEILAEEGDEVLESFLQSEWFYRAMRKIKEARKRNHLSQMEIAERLGTTQSVVARMENAHYGNFSVARFIAYAWACGVAPVDLGFVDAESMLDFAREKPLSESEIEAIDRWDVESAIPQFDFAVMLPIPPHVTTSEAPDLAARVSLAGEASAPRTRSGGFLDHLEIVTPPIPSTPQYAAARRNTPGRRQTGQSSRPFGGGRQTV